MSKTVTPEMVSAFVDGELSPEDKLAVERALVTDNELRDIAEGFGLLRNAMHATSEYVASTVRIPPQFKSDIMDRIQRQSVAAEPDHENDDVGAKSFEPRQLIDQNTDSLVLESEQSSAERSVTDKSLTGRPGTMSGFYSIRTLVEVIVATAAIVMIVLNWPTAVSDSEDSNQSVAKGEITSKDSVGNQKSPDVQMLSVGNGKGERNRSKSVVGGGNSKGDNQTNANESDLSSREFSIFVNESARANIDRFWIMKSYELSAPEQEPDGRVNMLLVDAKKGDAVKFFDGLKKWDPAFKCYQDSSKRTSASWLAPFDVAKISEAEGDYWKLRIVLISR